jgi:hypothetical protein
LARARLVAFKIEHFTEAAAARDEALVRTANGRLTDEARMIFDEALRYDAKSHKAQFFKGLAKDSPQKQRRIATSAEELGVTL